MMLGAFIVGTDLNEKLYSYKQIDSLLEYVVVSQSTPWCVFIAVEITGSWRLLGLSKA